MRIAKACQARLQALCSRFVWSSEGTTAVIFALLLIPVLLSAGAAIDYSRATAARSLVADSVDSAALIAAKRLAAQTATPEEIEQTARAILESNLAQGGFPDVVIVSVNVVQDPQDSEVRVIADAEMPTSLMALAGVTTVNIGASSVARSDERQVEISVMLDVTGSMSGQKIADLKSAASTLVDILFDDPGMADRTRIAIVPYSSSVNVGTYAPIVSDGASNDCVTERPGPTAVTDAPHTVEPLTDYEDTRTAGWQKKCPGAQILPLTDNESSLHAAIDGLTTDGGTSGHLGIGWSWYMLSPSWASLWPPASQPASYADANTLKYAILMTDGKFNTPTSSLSQSQARDLCDNMKDTSVNIRIYSVAFQLNDATARDILETCANVGGFYEAENGAELEAAFRNIAVDIKKLRLVE